MVTPKFLKFDTLSLHAGQQPDSATGTGCAIYQTTSYVFEDTDHAVSLYNLERPAYLHEAIKSHRRGVGERAAALEAASARWQRPVAWRQSFWPSRR